MTIQLPTFVQMLDFIGTFAFAISVFVWLQPSVLICLALMWWV